MLKDVEDCQEVEKLQSYYCILYANRQKPGRPFTKRAITEFDRNYI
jgi:hypothetical protein